MKDDQELHFSKLFTHLANELIQIQVSRASDIQTIKKSKTLPSLQEMAKSLQVIEFQKRRAQEDDCFKRILQLFTQDGSLSGRI